MGEHHLNLLSILTVTMFMFGATVKAVAPGVTLVVSQTMEPYSQSGSVVVNCSLDSSLTELETVASLTIFGARHYGSEEDLDQLATVDVWSNTPKLDNELEGANISITGGIKLGQSNESALVLAWISATKLHGISFKCLANGINRKGEATSIFRTEKVAVLDDAECCQKVDLVTSELERLTKVVQATANASTDVVNQVQGIDGQLLELEAKIDSIHLNTNQIQSINGKLLELEAKIDSIHLNTQVVSILSTVDKTKYAVSRLYKRSIYLASRRLKTFNIGADNTACQQEGGYLVEIDDDEESKFVLEFATAVGGTDLFMTGGNDLDQEGVFTYFNSKRPVPQLTWISGQPDNSRGREDCMHFWIRYKGLNDTPCNAKAKFICEIPV